MTTTTAREASRLPFSDCACTRNQSCHTHCQCDCHATPDLVGIQFTVPCLPVAQPRQSHRVVKAKGREFVQNFVPKRHPVHGFKSTVQMAFRNIYDGQPLEGPIGFSLLILLPRPSDMLWKKRPMPRVHQNRKAAGDWDNVAKAFCDALSGLAWHDDKQICSARVELWTAAADEPPGVEARIWRVE